jgi:hypothetical protein
MKVMTLSQALKLWGLAIGSAVLLNVSGYLVDPLITDGNSLWLRWLGVIVGVGSVVPWALFMWWMIGHVDEYHRHVALVGTAIAFVCEMLAHIGFNVMQDAHIVSSSVHLQEIPVAMIVWVLSVGASFFYHRLRL